MSGWGNLSRTPAGTSQTGWRYKGSGKMDGSVTKTCLERRYPVGKKPVSIFLFPVSPPSFRNPIIEDQKLCEGEVH